MGTIAVTGSASGIGAATTDRLQADGHQVIGVDLHDADVVADLATPEGRGDAVAAVTERCGGVLDGLVTCAGLGALPSRPGSLLVEVNYFGTVELLADLRPALARGTNPSAVAIASNSTTIQPGMPIALIDALLAPDRELARRLADEAETLAPYPCTKVAVSRFVRRNATKDEWIGAGIRLNAVSPGLITTALSDEQFADDYVGPLISSFPVPLGRPGRPAEMAALIAFLLGPESSFFCGSIVLSDGGSEALLRPDDWPAPWMPS